jgi:hypothetical protein
MKNPIYSGDLSAYLQASDIIDWQHPAILELNRGNGNKLLINVNNCSRWSYFPSQIAERKIPDARSHYPKKLGL